MTQQSKPETQWSKELLSRLKIDGKGWNVDLFNDNNVNNNCLCINCGNILCDAVELGCNHNDIDIYSYCMVCILQLIKDNNGKCPINSHDKPIINPVRSLRRTILEFKVVCPYSIKYKTKLKKQNNTRNNISQIINTNDQKEGPDDNINIVGCVFNDSLNNLINKHFISCIKKYDSSYSLNIIINKQKDIIDNLEMKLNQQTNDINNKNKINNLKKQNKDKINENTVLKYKGTAYSSQIGVTRGGTGKKKWRTLIVLCVIFLMILLFTWIGHIWGDSPLYDFTKSPTQSPIEYPTTTPTKTPTINPTINPTKTPTKPPTVNPTKTPTINPTATPTKTPTKSPNSIGRSNHEIFMMPILLLVIIGAF